MDWHHRYRLLFGLLLGTLVLSAVLNFYFLLQKTVRPVSYELEAGFASSDTELELEQTRAQLAECQHGHPLPDSARAHQP